MLEKVDLNHTPFKKIISRSVKKLLVELTSLKFLTLVFMGFLTYKKIATDFIGVMGMLAILGIREGFEYMSLKKTQ